MSTSVTAVAEDTDPEAQKAELEQRIAETNKKLQSLESESAETEEYMDTLNEKISYISEEVSIVRDEVSESEGEAERLETLCAENESALQKAQVEYDEMQAEYEEKTAAFMENYELFCNRMRAVYMTGETSTLAVLLGCNSLSDLFTRYEMIKRVSAQDGELLSAIDKEMKEITAQQEELADKNTELEQRQIELNDARADLEESTAELAEREATLKEKEGSLESEQEKANGVLQQLSAEKGYYTEYLQNDEAELRALDDDIAAAAAKYSSTLTTAATTAAATEEATEGQAASDGSGSSSSSSSSGSSSSSTTKATTKATTSSSQYISLTYPVPSQTTITCGYQQYSGHSGVDFSCPTGSTVVAAESGTVIISEDLKNADGSYRSYGRYIVIMHDKTTSSGAAVYTLYAHNSERLVSAGQHVEKGQTIARSGSTGNSTGPHCHFEVRTPTSAYSDCKNPVYYLP